ncbi:hypothetical protein F511_30735 [Dorcoceras hygrometricum]|uniref:Uncharacterized protein n=1 Tax=Dorcoceras hygrometricum TaxID=472368 RepID=A0A2Z7BA01_9LAMI|nr:hypothetical protein F511_30735 [Dorcoceras hygrometricum]
MWSARSSHGRGYWERVVTGAIIIKGSTGGASRRSHPPSQSQRIGFQPPKASEFRGPSQSQFSGPQQAQVNAMIRDQADDILEGVIAGAWLQPDSQGILARGGFAWPTAGGAWGDGREEVFGEEVGGWDTASRGRTTIVIAKSQFRTCPSDHDSVGYPRMKASGESSTTKHRLLHASGPHPILPPNDPKTNQYNQDLGLIHSTNGNHLESPNEGSSIDHQVTIHMHAQNITMFPTNETWYFASQMLVSSSGGLILNLTAQSTRNEFRIHSDY